MQKDYIKTARAKGLAERTVIRRHALKNALIPVVTIVGLQFGHMLANAVIIESLFARQGIGRLIVTGILSKDFPMVQGVVLFAAADTCLRTCWSMSLRFLGSANSILLRIRGSGEVMSFEPAQPNGHSREYELAAP